MLSKVKNLNFISKLVLVFVPLVVLFYIPLSFSSLNFSKTFLVYLFLSIITISALIIKIKSKESFLNFSYINIAVLFVLISYTLSAFFSKNSLISFIGRDFSVDSWLTVVVLFSITCIISKYFKKDFGLIFIWNFVILSGVISLIQLIHIFVPAWPMIGIFYEPVSNFVGKINDVAIFCSISLMFILMTLERLEVAKAFKIILYVVGSLNLLLVTLINFNIAIYALIGFAILFSLYKILFFVKFSRKNKNLEIKLFGDSFFVGIFFAALLLLGGGNFIQNISQKLNFNYLEVRPSVSSTYDVLKQNFYNDPVFGSGPSTFEMMWPKYRSKDVLTSDFWDADFRFGFSLLMTIIASTGFLGLVAWALFILVLIIVFIKSIFSNLKDSSNKFLIDSFAFAALFSWVFIIFYIPNIVSVFVTFVLTGVLFALAYEFKVVSLKKINLNPISIKISAILIGVIVLILVGHSFLRLVAHINFQRSIFLAPDMANIEKVKNLVLNSSKLDPQDTYYRALAKINSTEFFEKIKNTEDGKEVNVEEIKFNIKNTIDYYNQAIQYDPYNYNNYLFLADFYTDLIPLGISEEDSYKIALDLYGKVSELKPNNPLVELKKSKLEFLNGSVQGSRDLIIAAIKLRPAFLDAYIALSQLELNQGNNSDAVNIIKEYLKLVPNDNNALFELGALYMQIGDKEQAKNIFTDLNKKFPENNDVKNILNYLQSDVI